MEATDQESPSIPERMRDTPRLLKAMDKAVHDALRKHKLLGESIVVWEDGKVKIIPADQIALNGEPDNDDEIKSP